MYKMFIAMFTIGVMSVLVIPTLYMDYVERCNKECDEWDVSYKSYMNLGVIKYERDLKERRQRVLGHFRALYSTYDKLEIKGE